MRILISFDISGSAHDDELEVVIPGGLLSSTGRVVGSTATIGEHAATMTLVMEAFRRRIAELTRKPQVNLIA